MANHTIDKFTYDGETYVLQDNVSGYITDAGVTSFNGNTGAVTYTAPVTSVNGNTGAVTISVPTASTTTPSMDGTGSYGSGTSYARSNHVHPTDTSRASSTHAHGDITNGGDITNTATIASGDRIVINDESASKVTNSSITFGTSTTQFLANDGTWQQPLVDTASIPNGAITYPKIAPSAIKQMLAGLKVYHFDSANPNADNDGLAVPYTGTSAIRDKTWLAGYYIPAWTCLIITHFNKGPNYHAGNFFAGNSGWVLPSYVPKISADYHPYPNDSDSSVAAMSGFCQLSGAGLIIYSGGTVSDWTGVGLNADGTIGVNTENDSAYMCNSGSIVAFLDVYGAVDTSEDGYDYYNS